MDADSSHPDSLHPDSLHLDSLHLDSLHPDSLHLAVHIDRPADEVYAYAADPANLPTWAAGLASSEVTRVDNVWRATSPMGVVEIEFAARNVFGVLDHEVRLPDGEVVLNPMRVIPDGTGAEVVFTLRRRGMDDAAFAADAELVRADLARLRALLTRG